MTHRQLVLYMIEADLLRRLDHETDPWQRLVLRTELCNVAYCLGRYPARVDSVLPDVAAVTR